MKVFIEYEIDESIWGDEKDMKSLTDEQLINVFMGDPIEILGNAVWSFDFR